MSFCVSFIEHDCLAALAKFQCAGMSHEDDRDEAPYAVQTGVFIQGWYIIKGHTDRRQIGTYVPLIEVQVERVPRLERPNLAGLVGERIQGLKQAGNTVKLSNTWSDRRRSAARQELADAFTFLKRALPMLNHLASKVVRVEDEAVKQEARQNLRVATAALVAANP